MFAKLLLMSFIYEMLETFCFPDKKRQIIFQNVWHRKSLHLPYFDRHGQHIP